MRRKLILLCVTTLLGITIWANEGKQVIAILSVNDMHASIEHFPKLAALVDSLRGEYPSLLILSAGDNRTGNPLNDAYKEPSYPMTALMNTVGFHASAIGNHEFDAKVSGFVRQVRRSAFRYLCANVEPADSIHVLPYQFFDCEGIRIGILGLTQLGIHGIPDTHPLNVEGLRFIPAENAIERYGKEVRSRSDIAILLSHCGYEHDVALAKRFPDFDLIIGGHTHTRIEGTELHNGVLITQAENKLKYATLIRLVIEDGKVISKEAQLLPIVEVAKRAGLSEDMIEIDFSLLAEQKYRDEFLRVYKTYDFMSQGDNDMEQISFSVRMGSKLWEGDGEDDGFLGSVGFDNFIVHKKWKGNGFLGIQWFSYEGWLKLTGAEGLGSGEITLSKVSGHKGTGTSVIGYNSSTQLEKYTEYEPEDMDVSILGGNGMVYLGDIRNKKLSFKLYDQSTVFAGHNGCAVVFPFGW